MKLREAEIGNSYTIEKMKLPEDTGRRLRALGMTQETKITVLNRKKNGSVIFKVRGTRLAVGKDIAEAITLSAGNKAAETGGSDGR